MPLELLLKLSLSLVSEAKVLAHNNDCKYIEVSAILNHKVDDLLVGILKQIRINQDRMLLEHTHDVIEDEAAPEARCSSRCVDDSGCMTRTKDTVLEKIFYKTRSKSCENLLDL